ncbi:MAG: hypothetical protein II085_00760 [Alphaproteobacteria bacterium]|nr:hypothetical protein [Alphaproteobacteria bacterium]
MKENRIPRGVLLCVAWLVILAAGIATYFYLQRHPLAYFANHPWNGLNVAISIGVALFVGAIISLVIPDEPSEEPDDEERLEPKAGCFLTVLYIIIGIGVALYLTSIVIGIVVFLLLMIITVALDSPKMPGGGLDP